MTAFYLMTGLVAIAWALSSLSIKVQSWWERRNEREDSDYDALRSEGMGRLHVVPPNPGVYSKRTTKRPPDANPYAGLSPEQIDGDGA